MYDIFNMTAENTTKEALETDELFEAICSEENDSIQARKLAHVIEIAKSLGVKDRFKMIYNGYKSQRKKELSVKTEGSGNTTNFKGSYPSLRCGQWIVDEHGIRGVDNNGDTAVVSYEPITIVEKTKCIQTGDELITLAYKDGSTWQEKQFQEMLFVSVKSYRAYLCKVFQLPVEMQKYSLVTLQTLNI